MKTRTVILAGGEGSRLGVLTAKRTKPAVPFAGKYRILDFTLSNCVNSDLFDVLILAQYRPHSLIEHIGAGVPWDLDRNFTGGVSVHMPYQARGSSNWYLGTADAVQQNFLFIKRNYPDHVLILSGDHIYKMNYRKMIDFHEERQADLTIATITVKPEEASRFGILGFDENNRVTSFVEKPAQPPSNQANMGVYLFNTSILDRVLWDDHLLTESSHDFGKDILPRLVNEGKKVYAYPFSGYWVDVGTVDSYWQAHMDLLVTPPPIDLNDRSWVIHTRTEERPPVWIESGATIVDSLITDGCQIASGARIERSILSPGVQVAAGAVVRESVVLTDAVIEENALVERTIIDKKARIRHGAHVGGIESQQPLRIPIIGKHAIIAPDMVVEPGAVIGPDVIETDYPDLKLVRSSDFIQTKRLAHEV
ncbi:MAG: glucose-1-phosphate adenylyltransferase [Anaerolineae bacterium UTCFX2]|jgi:glucose-1-phosphate adenylyltransferase|nr:glucose-1-phosphate adenylyltransferase [Anaerolineae bacterium]MCZ7551084.1 glucose-1-phosphate adenylyltransferase [Anaerolineales bacterium]OQY93526.1 MAG: glucose-1-phosphate adenylyltransferase [Anaerolineae bacterium UTCFX2]